MKISLCYIFALSLLFVYSCNTSSLKKVETTDEYSKKIYFIDKDSLKQGTYVQLTLDGGDTISIANYKDDKEDGERRLFDREGNLSTIETYKNGVFHGPELTFYPNGQLYTRGNFTDGTLDSEFLVYFETGELKEKVTMVDNTENGPFEEYYKNGQLHWTGNFEDGPNEVGLLTEYAEDGEILKKMDCGKYKGDYICQTIWDKKNGDVKPKLEYDKN